MTPHTSHMARRAQKSIGKRQTGICGACRLPSVTASMGHPLQPTLQQYSAKSCCIGQYSVLALSRAHCGAIQQSTAIQRNAAYSNTSLYSLQHSTIPLCLITDLPHEHCRRGKRSVIQKRTRDRTHRVHPPPPPRGIRSQAETIHTQPSPPPATACRLAGWHECPYV